MIHSRITINPSVISLWSVLFLIAAAFFEQARFFLMLGDELFAPIPAPAPLTLDLEKLRKTATRLDVPMPTITESEAAAVRASKQSGVFQAGGGASSSANALIQPLTPEILRTLYKDRNTPLLQELSTSTEPHK